ncbi:MAG TPA: ABC transporter permease [Bryobacteraceae bacterium]|nr:ABC transporter permease [Bryobacteraceae bacterium]
MRSVVAWLIRLFPARFRREFGADMRATFEDRWRERPGAVAAVRIVLDLIAAIMSERFGYHPPEPEPGRKGDSLMAVLWQDLRFAVRTLGRSPAFTLVALAILALGIGINTAMFSIANAVLWQSLPYRDAGRIVWTGEVDRANPDNLWGASYLNFRDWQRRSHAFEQLGATLFDNRILREGAEPTRVSGVSVTREFFEMLGVQPALGRAFGPADERTSASPVIILSDAMWRQRFGADRAILGRAIRFDDGTFTVVGVMPPRFAYHRAEYFMPLGQVIDPYFATHRSVWVLNVIGRLRPGETPETAQTEVEGITRQIRHDYPECNRPFVVRVIPLPQLTGSDLRPALLALMGAVGVVLLIACANLAGLMSVRSAARAREMAIRSALGAASHRIIRQLLTECLVLAAAGGAAGIGLAFWATHGLQWLSKDPRLLAASINLPVLLFALAATLGTSLLFGVAPAVHAVHTDAAEALKSGPRSGGPRRAHARQALVVGQVALCVVLLAAAGLLFRSFERVLAVDPGFRADHLLTMRILLPARYEKDDAIRQADGRFMQTLNSLPGVNSATMVSALPFSGDRSTGDLTIEGRVSNPGDLGAVSFRRTMPGYFHVMGIPIVRGRDFAAADDAQHPAVTIISESIARRFWKGGDPIGTRIEIGPRDMAGWMTIVGVAKDVHQIGLDDRSSLATYQPFAQSPRHQMEIAIRTSGSPARLGAAAARELRRIEPGLIIDQVQEMSQKIHQSVAPRRMNLVLFGLFAGVALALAAVGLYGVVAFAAGQRTREFGIRMALGARPADVTRLVLGQGIALALAGVVLGMAAALWLTRLLTKLLFGVEPADPLTLATVALILTLVAITACWIPARRATRIDPTEALRIE